MFRLLRRIKRNMSSACKLICLLCSDEPPTSAVIQYRVHKRVKEQFDAFMAGFSELIPEELINVFDERELEVGVWLFL
jgi:hypothetical protein